MLINQRQAATQVSVKKRYENIYVPFFADAIKQQQKDTVQILKANGPYLAMMEANRITEKPMDTVLQLLYRQIAPLEAERVYRRNKITKTAAMGVNSADWLADVDAFLRNYILNNVSRQVTETTRQRLMKIINDAIDNGDSYDDMVAEINDIAQIRQRARLIARTETNRAVNHGAKMGQDKLPYLIEKVWIAAQDKRTRGFPGDNDKTDHYHMDGQTVDGGGLFIDPRSGASMEYPGDSQHGAGAGDICNCRCSMGEQAKRDVDGNIIFKAI